MKTIKAWMVVDFSLRPTTDENGFIRAKTVPFDLSRLSLACGESLQYVEIRPLPRKERK